MTADVAPAPVSSTEASAALLSTMDGFASATASFNRACESATLDCRIPSLPPTSWYRAAVRAIIAAAAGPASPGLKIFHETAARFGEMLERHMNQAGWKSLWPGGTLIVQARRVVETYAAALGGATVAALASAPIDAAGIDGKLVAVAGRLAAGSEARL